MPKLRLTGPNGEVKTISVSQVPNEEQMQQIIGKVFGGQTTPGVEDAPSVAAIKPTESPLSGLTPDRLKSDQPSGGNLLLDIQKELEAGAPVATELERQRDILEEQQRPSFGEFVSGAGKSVSKDLKTLADLGGKFLKSPIQSSKKVAGMVRNLTKDEAADFAKGLVKDFGKTIGFDIERPGVGVDKFDIDTLINRWQNQTLGAIGDASIVLAAAKGASALAKGAKGVQKSGTKIAMHNAIKRSGDEVKDMAEAVATAKNKAIERGAKIATTTPGEEVALKADIIKKIPLKNLNSADFPTKTSVQLADHIFDVGKREAVKMNRALNKVADKSIDTTKLSSSIKDDLIKKGFADNAKAAVDEAIEGAAKSTDAVNVITPLNKSKLSGFIKRMDDGKTMSVRELKNVLDVLDDSINWATPRTTDIGLKSMRAQIRSAIGEISPEYDKIASRIHDRLLDIGYAESKIKRAAKDGFLKNYKEKVGLEIAKSPERTKAFKNAMDIVGDETSAAALGKFELVDAWKAWNDLYDTNQQVFRFRGDAGGELIDRSIKFAQKRLRKAKPEFDLPSELRKIGSTLGESGQKLGRGAKSTAKSVPAGAAAFSLTEGLIE